MSAVRALREKLGEDGMSGLHIVVNDAGRQWKDDVLGIAGERFEKRLSEEIGVLRVDMAKEFAAVRVDMANGFAAVRAEMAQESAAIRKEMGIGLAETRADLLKWSFLFWVGQFAAVSAMMAFLLRMTRPG